MKSQSQMLKVLRSREVYLAAKIAARRLEGRPFGHEAVEREALEWAIEICGADIKRRQAMRALRLWRSGASEEPIPDSEAGGSEDT